MKYWGDWVFFLVFMFPQQSGTAELPVYSPWVAILTLYLFFTLLSPSITSSPLTSCNIIFLFFCSLRSRAAPCSPHPHRSTCRGWRVWWRPCRHQQRPAAPVQRTFCILHTLVHTNTHTLSYREHTEACIHISCPLVSAAGTVHTNTSIYVWSSCVWCYENKTHKGSTQPPHWHLGIFWNICWDF